ncbi:hypothetical protein SK128_010828 [Halocaridina rubra]|uniref:C-type lectin domain-containing protein n=1 Tax=Halocaridina rubra TaxID=373956 RepID=A0AAN8X863_HALRR
MKILFVVLVLVLASVPALSQGTSNITCKMPFQNIGSRCLFLDPLEAGTWYDMRLFCSMQGQGVDLVVLDDPNLLHAVYQYITEYGLDRTHYWIGASDQDAEGVWLWVDSTPVHLGAPYWRYDCDIENSNPLRPKLDSNANCAALDHTANFYFADFPCLGDGGDSSFSPICEDEPIYLDEYDDYEDESDEVNEE